MRSGIVNSEPFLLNRFIKGLSERGLLNPSGYISVFAMLFHIFLVDLSFACIE